MKIIITGACGYIGAALTRMAARAGHEVIGIDSCARGLNEPWMDARFIQWDCRVGLPPKLDPVDVVVHLAAGTGSLDRPMDELRALNVGMAQQVLGDAYNLRAQAFVFPTTSLALAVPDSPYVLSKEEGMAALKDIDREGLLIPLRFFNVLGEYRGITEWRRREVHVLPMLALAAATGEAFIINGRDYDTEDGTPGRDYTNIEDVCRFILMAAEAKALRGENFPRAGDGTIWVGTGQMTTTGALVELFSQKVAPVRADYGPRRAFDTGSLRCDDPSTAFTSIRMASVEDSIVNEGKRLLALMEEGDWRPFAALPAGQRKLTRSA